MPDAPQPIRIPISVCLIAKNERRLIKNFAEKLRPILNYHPDDEVILVDTGSVDGTDKVARDLGWQVHCHPELCTLDLAELGQKWAPKHWMEWSKHNHFTGGLLRSFAEARQISFNHAKNQYCLWLDLDDEIVNPQHLRPFIDQIFAKGGPGALFLRYDYAHAADGTCITTLWRERVVSKADFTWKGLCHETLLPANQSFAGYTMVREPNFPVYIKHVHPKPHKFSDLRNYVILRNDLEVNPYKDPRTRFYLGNACRGLDEWEEAIRWYEEFVKESGSRDDVLAAYYSIAGCYVSLDRQWKALEACAEAERTAPDDPRAYYTKASIWFQLGNWKNVLTYVQLGDQFKMPDTLHAVDETALKFQPPVLAAIAARQLHAPDEALRYAEKAVRQRPQMIEMQKLYHDMFQWASAEKGGQALMTVLNMAQNPKAILRYATVSPHLVEIGLGRPEEVVPGVEPGKKTVAIWCGRTFEGWGPKSVETGIGASEKMVVDLAKALAKRGFAVTVYNHLNSEEGEYDGVHYRWCAHFNPALYRDYVIIWRQPQALATIPFRAGQIYIWMHDVGHNSMWTPPVLERVTKVLFLSQFQRNLHPAVPEEKVYYTRNGIDLARHLYDGTPKQKKIVYCSSPDRGWLRAIEVFRESCLAHEGWQLHLFYGFGRHWRQIANDLQFGHVAELGKEMRLLDYEEECKAACDGKTIINRGRVGWDVMARELKEAQIWLYPTRFDEISCVAAMEAMAAGCRLVATDHAALKETLAGYPGWTNLNKWPQANWPSLLRDAAELGPTPIEADWGSFARKFDIELLAEQWAKELFSEQSECADPTTDGPGPEVVDGTTSG